VLDTSTDVLRLLLPQPDPVAFHTFSAAVGTITKQASASFPKILHRRSHFHQDSNNLEQKEWRTQA
jgi:hypothetical protein